MPSNCREQPLQSQGHTTSAGIIRQASQPQTLMFHSWLYRIKPSAEHSKFERVSHSGLVRSFGDIPADPNQVQYLSRLVLSPQYIYLFRCDGILFRCQRKAKASTLLRYIQISCSLFSLTCFDLVSRHCRRCRRPNHAQRRSIPCLCMQCFHERLLLLQLGWRLFDRYVVFIVVFCLASSTW